MSLTSNPRVDWHEAASCAFQIELNDYSHILEYISKYPLGKNSYRIDLLVIKKLTDEMIPKNIARIFRTFNLIEIKGVGSSISIDSYYKTIGYAGLLIAPYLLQKSPMACIISIKRLFMCKLSLQKSFLPKMICICTVSLIIFRIPLKKTKGDKTMVCEGLLNLCGTSSAEIIERTKKEEAEYYLPKIEQLSSQNDSLSSQNNNLSSRITYLESLLKKNNIAFDFET